MSLTILRNLSIVFWTSVAGVVLSFGASVAIAIQEHRAEASRDLSKIAVPAMPGAPAPAAPAPTGPAAPALPSEQK